MVAGSPRTKIMTVDHVGQKADDADSWIGGPNAMKVSADSDYPAARMERDTPGEGLRTTGVIEADGRVGRSFTNARSLDGAVMTGHNLTQTGVVRYLGGDYVFADSLVLDGTSANVLTSTTANLTATDAATYRIVCRIRPIDGGTDRNAETWFYFGTDPTNDSLYDVALQFRGTGNVGVRARIARYSGSNIDLEYSTAEIDDGVTREYIIRVDDSDTSADLLIDGVSVDSSSSAPAFGSGASQEIEIGNDPMRMEVFSVTRVGIKVEDADLEELRRNPEKFIDCSPHWNMSGTGSVIDDQGPGSHTGTVGGTTVRGVEIAQAKTPLVDSSTTNAWGDWSVRQAINLGTTGSISRTVSATVPRSMTATMWIRVPKKSTSMSTAYVPLWIGASSGAADIDIRFAGGDLRVRSLRTSTLARSIWDEVKDGEWHFLQVDLLGRGTPTMTLYVDGTQADTGTTGAYVSASSWSVNLAGSTSTTGIEIADLRVYGYLRGATTIDYRATVPPWDARELLFEMQFDGHLLESISGSAATASGNHSYVEWANPNSSSAQRPGAGQGIEQLTNITADLPPIVARDFAAPARCLEAAVLLWDPKLGSTDNYYEIDSLRFLAGSAFELGRSPTAVLRNVDPPSIPLPGGAHETPGGARYLHLRVEYPALTLAERDSLHRAFQRLGADRPFLVLSIIWDDDQPLYSAIWGTRDGDFESTEHPTDTRGRFSASIGIKALMVTPLRI